MNTQTERLAWGAGALVIGLLLGWGIRGVSTYNKATETATTYSDWRTICPPAAMKDQKCQMIEDVLDSKSQSPVVRISISTDENAKQVLGLTLPFGVSLQPGVGLVLGTDPVRVFPFRTCTQQGCIAVLTLDDKAQDALKNSKDARILVAGLDNKPVAVPLSLKGYPEALSGYRSNEAKRNSWFRRLFS